MLIELDGEQGRVWINPMEVASIQEYSSQTIPNGCVIMTSAPWGVTVYESADDVAQRVASRLERIYKMHGGGS